MTTAPIHFTAARKDAEQEPIGPFLVGDDPTPFYVPRPVPAQPLLDLARAAEEMDEPKALAAFSRFLDGCLPPADRLRFRNAVTEARMSAEDLLPIVQYLVAEGMGRPTVPPSLWPAPSGSDGRMPNTAGSLPGAPAPSPH